MSDDPLFLMVVGFCMVLFVLTLVALCAGWFD